MGASFNVRPCRTLLRPLIALMALTLQKMCCSWGGFLILDTALYICSRSASRALSEARQSATCSASLLVMALRVLAAALLGAAAWQCAFVGPLSGSRAPQVSAKASGSSSRGAAAEDQDFMAPFVSLSVGAMAGLLVAVAGAAPAYAQRNQGYSGNVDTDLVRYDKPAGTDNLLKELKGDKKKFYEGKKDLDYRAQGYKMELYKTERELQAKMGKSS